MSQVAGFVLQKEGAGKIWGEADYFCDVGSWLLPEVPLAATREMAAPRGAGTPRGTAGTGSCRDTLAGQQQRETPEQHPGRGEQRGERAPRVGRETQHCRGAAVQHLCRVLSLLPAPSQTPGEGTCSCPPLLKPFPPGLPCNSGVPEKEGLFNPFPPGASWLLAWQPQHTSPGLMLWPL